MRNLSPIKVRFGWIIIAAFLMACNPENPVPPASPQPTPATTRATTRRSEFPSLNLRESFVDADEHPFYLEMGDGSFYAQSYDDTLCWINGDTVFSLEIPVISSRILPFKGGIIVADSDGITVVHQNHKELVFSGWVSDAKLINEKIYFNVYDKNYDGTVVFDGQTIMKLKFSTVPPAVSGLVPESDLPEALRQRQKQ